MHWNNFPSLANGRLHDLKCILGYTALQRLKELKLFLVGSGALGCEFLKVLFVALLREPVWLPMPLILAGCYRTSLCCHLCSEGLLTVTDMDTIEVRPWQLFKDRGTMHFS